MRKSVKLPENKANLPKSGDAGGESLNGVGVASALGAYPRSTIADEMIQNFPANSGEEKQKATRFCRLTCSAESW